MRRVLWAIAAFALATSATAQPASQLRDSTTRGIEAQYAAAQVRERRLADDRERRLLDQAEARLVLARADFDRERAGAAQELEAARAEFARIANEYALRDATARAEIEAYRAEARAMVAEATPERLAAMQRFADGDRVGAWPVLEQLRIAEDRAIAASANVRRAVGWRQDAQLRMIMRDNGEASTDQVRALWEQAALLDPSEPWALYNLAREQRRSGQQMEALGTLTQLVTLLQRGTASSGYGPLIAREMEALGGTSAETRSFTEAEVESARRRMEEEPNSVAAMTSLAEALRTSPSRTPQMLDEAEALARRAFSLEPTDSIARVTLAYTLMLRSQGEQNGAAALRIADEALRVSGAEQLAQNASAPARTDAARIYVWHADAAVKAGDIRRAEASYRRAEQLHRSVWTQDSSLDNLEQLSQSTLALSDFLQRNGRHEEGARVLEEALARYTALPEDLATLPSASLTQARLLYATAQSAVFYGGDVGQAAERLARARTIVDIVRRSRNESPGQAPTTAVLGEIYYAQAVLAQRAQDWPRAIELGQKAAQEDPFNPSFMSSYAFTFSAMAARETDTARARAGYERALQIADAINSFDSIPNPLRRDIQIERARIHGELGRLAFNEVRYAVAMPLLMQAVQEFEAAIPADDAELSARHRFGLTYFHSIWANANVMNRGDAARSVTAYARVLQLLPEPPRSGSLTVGTDGNELVLNAHLGLACFGPERDRARHLRDARALFQRFDQPARLQLFGGAFNGWDQAGTADMESFQAWCRT